MAEINFIDNCYPGMVPGGEVCFRFNDKDVNSNEQMLYDSYWQEILNQYGQKITYYVNTYNILSADNMYGESPTKQFADPIEIVMAIELNENADTLSRYGFSSDDEVTVTVHVSSFYNAFRTLSSSVYSAQFDLIEPRSGDVFALTEYGKGRRNGRGAKYYEVTDRIDQDISSINQLGGHYVWRLKAKRFEYSFEPGLSAEKANTQVYENAYSGVLSGVGNNPTNEKRWVEDIDKISSTTVFNMSANNDTDVYGGYYG
jgi:hypothetical protein